MTATICIACNEYLDDGPALGALCYECIERTVLDHIRQEKAAQRKEKEEQLQLARFSTLEEIDAFLDKREELIKAEEEAERKRIKKAKRDDWLEKRKLKNK